MTLKISRLPAEPWVEPIVSRLNDFLSLPPNWDSYGAEPVSMVAAQATISLLETIMSPTTPIPYVVPTSNGSIQLEWHEIDVDLIVEHVASGWSVFFQDSSGGREMVTTDTRPLIAYLQKLTPLRGRLGHTYLFGGGGHGRVVGEILAARGVTYSVLDDTMGELPEIHGQIFHGIGDNKVRQALQTIRYPGALWHALRSRAAYIAQDAEIGPGSQLLNQCYVGPGTTIGAGAIINNHASVDHDCRIGSFVHIAPGSVLCGGVEIGDLSLIGAGAVIGPKVKIGEGCLIAMGSRIAKNLPSGSIVTLSGRIRE